MKEGSKMNELCPVCQSPVEEGTGVCPSCGFKLLGATQAFEPCVIDGKERSPKTRFDVSCALHVVRGPQAGATYQIDGDELTIGRSPNCSIFLNDMTVSRMHATLRREGTSYVIEDANSFNGVWVNNSSVNAKALSNGDVVQIGTFYMVYEEN